MRVCVWRTREQTREKEREETREREKEREREREREIERERKRERKPERERNKHYKTKEGDENVREKKRACERAAVTLRDKSLMPSQPITHTDIYRNIRSVYLHIDLHMWPAALQPQHEQRRANFVWKIATRPNVVLF